MMYAFSCKDFPIPLIKVTNKWKYGNFILIISSDFMSILKRNAFHENEEWDGKMYIYRNLPTASNKKGASVTLIGATFLPTT